MQVALACWHSAWGSLDHAQGWVWAGLVRGEFAKANMSIESVCHPGASPGAVASDRPCTMTDAADMREAVPAVAEGVRGAWGRGHR